MKTEECQLIVNEYFQMLLPDVLKTAFIIIVFDTFKFIFLIKYVFKALTPFSNVSNDNPFYDSI